MADIDSNLPVRDFSDGTPGSAVPTAAQQIGGTDGANLRTFSVDTTGKVNINNISGVVSLPTGASTSANQTNASQKTQVVDGSGNVISSLSNTLNITFISKGSGSQGALTVGTTAVLVNVSGSNLSNRVHVAFYNNSLVPIYWGVTSGVTTSSGIPIAPGQSWEWDVGTSTNIYVIAGTTSNNGRVVEMAR